MAWQLKDKYSCKIKAWEVTPDAIISNIKSTINNIIKDKYIYTGLVLQDDEGGNVNIVLYFKSTRNEPKKSVIEIFSLRCLSDGRRAYKYIHMYLIMMSIAIGNRYDRNKTLLIFDGIPQGPMKILKTVNKKYQEFSSWKII